VSMVAGPSVVCGCGCGGRDGLWIMMKLIDGFGVLVTIVPITA
jgi:hypothetical protein